MTIHSLFTSESVSEGHPDKIADQISDAILDSIIAKDKNARVACETLIKTGMVLVSGEITTTTWVDIEEIVRNKIREIGYNSSDLGFDADSCAVLTAISKQSPDIAMGVDNIDPSQIGAGDQGMVFGFACDETDVLMPGPIFYAHELVKRQAFLRKSGATNWLRPDAKSQVTLKYNGHMPIGVETVVFSTQHQATVSHKKIQEFVIEEIIKPTFPKNWLDNNTKYFINPTGRFIIGGH